MDCRSISGLVEALPKNLLPAAHWVSNKIPGNQGLMTIRALFLNFIKKRDFRIAKIDNYGIFYKYQYFRNIRCLPGKVSATSVPPTNIMQSIPTTTRSLLKRCRAAFTLVEMLLVIAIISILAAMVISSFSDAAQTSREVVARQQLAVWQSALNNWVNGKLGKVDTIIDASGAPITLGTLRNYYTNTLNTKTARWLAITGMNLNGTVVAEGYLDPMTAAHYLEMASRSGVPANMDKIKSDAMIQTGRWLELPDWVEGGTPTVELH